MYKLTRAVGTKAIGGPREKGSKLEDFRESFTSLELNLKRRISYFHSCIRYLFSICYVLGTGNIVVNTAPILRAYSRLREIGIK